MFDKPAKFILDLIFPITCLSCGKEGDWLCPNCFSHVALKEEPARTIPPLNKLLVACDYQNQLVKKLVLNLKYNFIRDLADPMARLMSQKLARYYSENQDTILIPVPLHKKRLRWRGFNQAELLADQIGEKLKIPVDNKILIRNRHALPQAKIEDAQKRQENIKNSFALGSYPCKDKTLLNKTAILIDDIATTGATLRECAKALKPLRPRQIWALVFACG